MRRIISIAGVLVLCCILYFVVFAERACANNISVSNAIVGPQNSSTDVMVMQFDISWSNSWRDSDNYDAAWVFLKYSTDGGTTWSHATLKTSGANPADCNIGSGTVIDIIVPTDKKGAFLQRAANGTGALSTTSVQLTWDYGTDITASTKDTDAALAIIKVMAIEMVYIPTGSFSVGSGGSETSAFYTYPTTTTIYTIGSEGAITVGTENGNLYYASTTYGGDQTGPIPANFPKGYSAFYIMKYEASQGQYRDFLNTLTRAQQAGRVGTSLAAGTTLVTNRYVMSNTDTLQNRIAIRCDATIHTSNPITFYCDFDGDGAADESGDGEWIACGYLSTADMFAYADWAGLRPMTEFEYEKACRGAAAAVSNEYAWGSTDITNADGLTNSGLTSETVSGSGNGLCNYNNDSILGMLRCGFGATTSTTRIQAGASFYGVIDMSGNAWERCVSAGNATSRLFTGLQGDGALDSSGNANVANWPTSLGFRGSGWEGVSTYVRVSDRAYANGDFSDRVNTYGIRCVRTS